jgi:GIY-YIG catalytic domain
LHNSRYTTEKGKSEGLSDSCSLSDNDGKNRVFLRIIFILILVLILYCLLFSTILFCESAEDLPYIIEVKDLYLTESIREARSKLRGVSGIYSLMHQDTGAIYIGSWVDLWNRLYDHIINHSSKLHLQNAILMYGLAAFTFKVIEQCSKDMLLEREQHWLSWLFH